MIFFLCLFFFMLLSHYDGKDVWYMDGPDDAWWVGFRFRSILQQLSLTQPYEEVKSGDLVLVMRRWLKEDFFRSWFREDTSIDDV